MLVSRGELVLQIRVPELVDRAGLSQDLPVPRCLEQAEEPHRPTAHEERELGAEQDWHGAVSETADDPDHGSDEHDAEDRGDQHISNRQLGARLRKADHDDDERGREAGAAADDPEEQGGDEPGLYVLAVDRAWVTSAAVAIGRFQTSPTSQEKCPAKSATPYPTTSVPTPRPIPRLIQFRWASTSSRMESSPVA